MSKKTQSKSRSKARSKGSKSGNIVIRRPYLYAGGAVLAVVVVVIVLVAALSGSGDKAAPVAGLPNASNKPQIITPAQYEDVIVSGKIDHTLIDVRTPEEYATEHIDGAVNINVEEMFQHLNEIPKTKPIVVYCRSGNRSAQAAQILDANGFSNVYDLGGINNWKAQGLPVVK